MKTKKPTFNPGDRIAYTRAFVKSTGSCYEMAQRRGTFVEMDGIFAFVRWDDETARQEPAYVHSANICRLGSVAFAD
jgi:hypothetical protein